VQHSAEAHKDKQTTSAINWGEVNSFNGGAILFVGTSRGWSRRFGESITKRGCTRGFVEMQLVLPSDKTTPLP